MKASDQHSTFAEFKFCICQDSPATLAAPLGSPTQVCLQNQLELQVLTIALVDHQEKEHPAAYYDSYDLAKQYPPRDAYQYNGPGSAYSDTHARPIPTEGKLRYSTHGDDVLLPGGIITVPPLLRHVTGCALFPQNTYAHTVQYIGVPVKYIRI
jgi:hypothetical protein